MALALGGYTSLFNRSEPLLGKQSRIIKLLGEHPRPVRDLVALG